MSGVLPSYKFASPNGIISFHLKELLKFLKFILFVLFSGSVGLLVKNFHGFQLLENLFISTLFIRIFLLNVELGVKNFFSFGILKMLSTGFHCF